MFLHIDQFQANLIESSKGFVAKTETTTPIIQKVKKEEVEVEAPKEQEVLAEAKIENEVVAESESIPSSEEEVKENINSSNDEEPKVEEKQ